MSSESVRQAFGYLYPAEMTFLRELAEEVPDGGTIVNIGAGAGTSGLLFLEVGRDIKVYTIDIREFSSPYGSLDGERAAVREAGLEYLEGDRWFQIEGDSKEVARTWLQDGYPRPHLVFVDGDHRYMGAYGDLTGWMPLIVPGGIMAIHDYNKEKTAPDYDGRIKPHMGVDLAVYDVFLSKEHDLIGQADTVIAFRIGAQDQGEDDG